MTPPEGKARDQPSPLLFLGVAVARLRHPFDNGSVLPGFDSTQPTARQRFTIAHELGHLLLHEGEEVHIDKDFRVNLRSPLSSAAVSVEEIEANTFAATLLMPIRFLMRDVQNKTVDVEDGRVIQDLAGQYGVSVQAMTYRLTNVLRLR